MSRGKHPHVQDADDLDPVFHRAEVDVVGLDSPSLQPRSLGHRAREASTGRKDVLTGLFEQCEVRVALLGAPDLVRVARDRSEVALRGFRVMHAGRRGASAHAVRARRRTRANTPGLARPLASPSSSAATKAASLRCSVEKRSSASRTTSLAERYAPDSICSRMNSRSSSLSTTLVFLDTERRLPRIGYLDHAADDIRLRSDRSPTRHPQTPRDNHRASAIGQSPV